MRQPDDDNQTDDEPMVGHARFFVWKLIQKSCSAGTATAYAIYTRCQAWLWSNSSHEDAPRPSQELGASLLVEMSSQRDFNDAIRLLLRRLIYNPQTGFAALAESTNIDNHPLRSLGISQKSRQKLLVSDDLRKTLLHRSCLTLRGKELRDHDIFQNLEPCDRCKVEQLYLFRLGDPNAEFDVFVTTELFSVHTSLRDRLQFLKEMLNQLVSLWEKNRTARLQKVELETDQIFQAPQPVINFNGDTSLESIRQYVEQLRKILKVDRVTLFAPRGTESMTRLAVSGTSMLRGIDEAWQQHEYKLVAAGLGQDHLIRFDAARLREYAIDSLIGGAVISPVIQNDCVVAVLCMTSSTPWPLPIRAQRSIQDCTECIQETIANLSRAKSGGEQESSQAASLPGNETKESNEEFCREEPAEMLYRALVADSDVPQHVRDSTWKW